MNPFTMAVAVGAAVLAMGLPVVAATPTASAVTAQHLEIRSHAAYHLVVNKETVDTSDLPAPAHMKDGVLMVPLRRTAEALGYTVTWDDVAKQTRVDMSIAYMYFTPGMTEYERIGTLKVININHLYDFKGTPELIEGVLYVPAEVFTAFYNDVSVAGNVLSISPQVSYTMMGQ